MPLKVLNFWYSANFWCAEWPLTTAVVRWVFIHILYTSIDFHCGVEYTECESTVWWCCTATKVLVFQILIFKIFRCGGVTLNRCRTNVLINFIINLISYNLLFILVDKLFLNIKNNSGILIFIFYAKSIPVLSLVLFR